MKTRIIILIAVGFMYLSLGCRTATETPTLQGEWECTDLSAHEHISHFVKLTIGFQADGNMFSFLTGENGQQAGRKTESYQVKGDILLIGDVKMEYRYAVSKKFLSLTVTKAIAKSDLGKTLRFTRKAIQ